MSLRHRLLILFAALAVAPLLTLGGLDYARARRAVERIVSAQAEASAKRAANLIAERYAILQSDALLLSENSETQTLFRALADRDENRVARARAAADTFARVVWARAGRSYRFAEFRDRAGSVVARLNSDTIAAGALNDSDPPPIKQPIVRDEPAARLGTVVLQPLWASIFPSQLPGVAFGRSGYVIVTDSASQFLLYDSRRTTPGTVPLASLHLGVAFVNALRPGQPGLLRYAEADSERIGFAELIPGPGWRVIASTAMPEFTAGLGEERALDLLLVVAIAAAIAIVFTVLIHRATRSLEELRLAADAVGRGEMSPRLPPDSGDEVGTLSGAFAHMLDRVRTMMHEIEESRQLAMLGEFSAQLAHEIRNPLTSLKLNLQALTRAVTRGQLPASAMPQLDTSLRAVHRLDGVVRDVLQLARTEPGERVPCRTHEILRHVLEVHEPELGAAGISVVEELRAPCDTVSGTADQLVGVFTNLIVNAIDAQPAGGRLLVSSCVDGRELHVLLADDGVGVAPDMADRIFRPFVTGRSNGTGLGLPMAQKVASGHGGSVALVSTPTGYRGAAFRVTLPLI